MNEVTPSIKSVRASMPSGQMTPQVSLVIVKNMDLEAPPWQPLAGTANKTLEKVRFKTLGAYEL